jgi:hypothetical protein
MDNRHSSTKIENLLYRGWQHTMRKFPFIMMVLFIFIAFFLQILALLKIFPLLLSTPILFVSIFIFIFYLHDRKRFRGF